MCILREYFDRATAIAGMAGQGQPPAYHRRTGSVLHEIRGEVLLDAQVRYCVKCTARYWRGAAARKQLAPPEDDAPQDVSGNCANCGEPLPPGQSAVNSYCAKCAAAWQRGPTAQK